MRTSLLNILFFSALTLLTACSGGGSSGNNISSSTNFSSAVSSSSPASSSASSASSETINLYSLADFPIGVAINAGNESLSLLAETANGETQRALVEAHFSQLTAGNIMKMSYLHPAENTYNFVEADALLNYAINKGISLHAHTLIWHSDYQIPAWMNNYVGNQDAWLALIESHVQNIAGHFAGKVPSWDVVNEAFEENGSYRNSLFYQKMGSAYIETAFKSARAADPDADLYYNDFNISNGEAKFLAVMEMVDDFQERDIPIDGIGFQMHVQMGWPSITAIKNSFTQVVNRGLKVKITELDIPINNAYDGSYNYPNNYQAVLTAELAAAQKKRYCEIVSAYMEVVPAELRGGITVWGIRDSDSWLISFSFNNNHDDWPLLFDNDYNPKPAFYGVADGLTGQPCL